MDALNRELRRERMRLGQCMTCGAKAIDGSFVCRDHPTRKRRKSKDSPPHIVDRKQQLMRKDGRIRFGPEIRVEYRSADGTQLVGELWKSRDTLRSLEWYVFRRYVLHRQNQVRAIYRAVE